MQADQIGVWGRAPTGGWGGRAPPLHELQQFYCAIHIFFARSCDEFMKLIHHIQYWFYFVSVGSQHLTPIPNPIGIKAIGKFNVTVSILLFSMFSIILFITLSKDPRSPSQVVRMVGCHSAGPGLISAQS